jgi:hypothetical protein
MANFGAGIIHIADVGSVFLSGELLEGTGPSAMELFQSQRSEPLTTLKIATQLVHKVRLHHSLRGFKPRLEFFYHLPLSGR